MGALTVLLIGYAIIAQWTNWPRIWLAHALGVPAWGWWILLYVADVSRKASAGLARSAKVGSVVKGLATGEIEAADL